MDSYLVEVSEQVSKEVRSSPGNIRQRLIRTLKALQQEPRPENSQLLDIGKAGIELELGTELRRIRIEYWRVVYLIEEDIKLISVLAIRKRPPYQYEDLKALIEGF